MYYMFIGISKPRTALFNLQIVCINLKNNSFLMNNSTCSETIVVPHVKSDQKTWQNAKQ